MEEIKTFETATQKLKIYQDECPESPREWDNLGTMICSHRRYNLGDKHDFDFNDYNSWVEAENAIKRKYDVAVMLPLYLYDHSGITINTTGFSCPWDSGQVGYIIVSKETLRKEYNVKRITKAIIEKAKSVLESEVKTYDQYIMGEVYGFEVTDKDDNVIDSCWGFYGDDFLNNGIGDHLNDELKELLK